VLTPLEVTSSGLREYSLHDAHWMCISCKFGNALCHQYHSSSRLRPHPLSAALIVLNCPGLTATGDDIGAPLLPPESLTEPKSVRLGYVSGLISADRVLAFERLLFRATRGNMYLK
jgi:hypothetical protein